MKRNVLLSDSEDDWNQSLDSIRKIFINSRIQIFKKNENRFSGEIRWTGELRLNFSLKDNFSRGFRRTASSGWILMYTFIIENRPDFCSNFSQFSRQRTIFSVTNHKVPWPLFKTSTWKEYVYGWMSHSTYVISRSHKPNDTCSFDLNIKFY